MSGPEPPLIDERSVVLRRRLVILVWRAIAVLALLLGLIGVALPVMPTVPFLLVSAWAAGKGWPSFERWLLAHERFGPPIRHWRERGAIPRRAKWISTSMMAISGVGLQFVATLPLWLRLGVPAIMLSVAIWVWTRPE